jgi:hypothetical protein
MRKFFAHQLKKLLSYYWNWVMPPEQREEWKQIRQKGLLSFFIRYGVLYCGIASIILSLLPPIIFSGGVDWQRLPLTILSLNILGWVFVISIIFTNEQAYKETVDQKG